ncbi:SDR family NAD(P)-dependent oxidoreductase [Nakamurella lactea]|uniref:SDR family NAD(P)-dependent oxidoreductase n=1 Tax=Nakamurella lactea TaxID=459515 RepID=UPI00048D5069|nr:SDR family NAD(P)-dependent oxidoreductase [Nakamurella lactea]
MTAGGLPRRAVVTGANTGLGLATSTALAAAGWSVTLAVRSPAKGHAAAAGIRAQVPGADLQVRRIDLADLGSVRSFADEWRGPLAVLVNNAGVMLAPERELTPAGLEQQIGVNHFGHYLLTARLLPALAEGAGRVVSVSSIAHRAVRRLDRKLNLAGRYTPMGAYGQSKLAVLMFALELDRRLLAAHSPVTSVAAHPGWSATETLSPGDRGDTPGPLVWLARRVSQLLGSSAAHGARSQVLAATAPRLPGGSYYGPRFGLYGRPHRAAPSRAARNADDARWLFDTSAEITGETIRD